MTSLRRRSRRTLMSLCAGLMVVCLYAVVDRHGPAAAPRLPWITTPRNMEAHVEGHFDLSRLQLEGLDSLPHIIFVFDPACSACRLNIGNWYDLVAYVWTSSKNVRFFTVAPGRADGRLGRRYWGPLAKVLAVHSRSVGDLANVGIKGTPQTLFWNGSQVVYNHYGILTNNELDRLRQLIMALP